MRQVAIFPEKLKEDQGDRVQVDPKHVQSFELNRFSVTTGLLQTIDTPFDAASPAFADKVLVRKRAFSCNYRDKALLLKAKHKLDHLAERDELRFFTLGSEFAAEVLVVGNQVQNLAPGDRVVGNGNYPHSGYEGVRPGLPTNHGSKELEVFHYSKLVKIPEMMTDVVAASFPIGGQTTYSMIRRLNLQEGEKVLVTAATSNTSLFAISALKNVPVEVYAVTTRDTYVDRLKELGADGVFVVPRGLKSLAREKVIFEHIKIQGLFNAVIDPFFDVYLGQVVDVMDLGARYITCGMYEQPHVGDEETVKQLPNNLNHIMSMTMMKNLQLIGNCIGNTEDLDRAIADYAAGKLEVVIDSVYQQHQESQFFDRSFNDPQRFGKVVYRY